MESRREGCRKSPDATRHFHLRSVCRDSFCSRKCFCQFCPGGWEEYISNLRIIKLFQPPPSCASDYLYYLTFKLSHLICIKTKNEKESRIFMGQVISPHIPLERTWSFSQISLHEMQGLAMDTRKKRKQSGEQLDNFYVEILALSLCIHPALCTWPLPKNFTVPSQSVVPHFLSSYLWMWSSDLHWTIVWDRSDSVPFLNLAFKMPYMGTLASFTSKQNIPK